MRWVTFYSQTGSEIVEISKQLNRAPDIIITNHRPEGLRTISPDIKRLDSLFYTLPNRPEVQDYLTIFQDNGLKYEDTLITLHGWLRVVPVEMIESYRHIYNGHPGLITRYPELKGKDPQKKAWDLNLQTSGCVIHRVTPEVDGGSILRSKEIPIRNLSLDELYRNLHTLSIEMWVSFLRRHWLSAGEAPIFK
jgi:folate-dependent phosphoribosylglycinamide formyltransferase PurN